MRFTLVKSSSAVAGLAVVAVLALTAGCGSSSSLSASSASGTSGTSSQPSTQLSAPGSSASAVSSVQPISPTSVLAQAAKKEGTLTVYTDFSQNAAQAQAAAFTKEYGVKVNVVRLAGATLATRFLSEEKAGSTSADVVVSASPVFAHTAVTSGYTVPLDKAGIPGYPWQFPAHFLNTADGQAATMIEPTGIAYNTNLVKGSDIPKTWTDLLDPKWKGKIGIADPSTLVGYDAEWVVLQDLIGDGFLQKLGKQSLKTYSGGAPLAAAVGSGEIALAPAELRANITAVKNAGGPIAIVVPDKTSGLQDQIMLVARNKHPNAAKLFVAYSMSPAGAEIAANVSESLSPYSTSKLPSDYVGADYTRGTAEQAQISTWLIGKK